MKERSIQEFADKQGLKRRIIHAPGALGSWEKEAAKLTDRKATEIEGFLIALFDAWIDNSRLNNRWAVPEGNLNKDKKFFCSKANPDQGLFLVFGCSEKYDCYQSLCLQEAAETAN